MIILGVIGLFVLCAGFGVLWGFIRGAKKSLVRLIIFVAASLLAFFITKPVTEALFRNVAVHEGRTIEEIIRDMLEGSGIGGLFVEGSYLGDIINKLPIMLGSIAVFLVLFLLLKYLSLIVYAIVMIFIKTDAEKKKGIGMIYGAVSGLTLFIMLMIPVSGLIDVAHVVSKYEINGQTLLGENINDEIDNYQNSFISSFGKIFGMNTEAFNYLTTQEIAGRKRNLIDVLENDLGSIIKLINAFSKLQNMDFESMSLEELKGNIEDILEALKNLPPEMVQDLGEALAGQLGGDFSDVDFPALIESISDPAATLSLMDKVAKLENSPYDGGGTIAALISELSVSSLLDISYMTGIKFNVHPNNLAEVTAAVESPATANKVKLRAVFGLTSS